MYRCSKCGITDEKAFSIPFMLSGGDVCKSCNKENIADIKADIKKNKTITKRDGTQKVLVHGTVEAKDKEWVTEYMKITGKGMSFYTTKAFKLLVEDLKKENKLRQQTKLPPVKRKFDLNNPLWN